MIFLNILSLFFTLVIACVWIFFKYWRRNKYTRERYAFFSSALITNLSIFAISNIYGEPLVITIINYILGCFDRPLIEQNVLGLSDRLLILMILGILSYYFYNVFTKWNTSISVRQHELTELSKETLFLFEAWYAFRNWNSLQVYKSQDLQNVQLNVKEAVIQHLAWHEQVAELLTLYSNQYIINVETDWYAQEHCFISSYGQSHVPLAIFCKHEKPSDAKINEFIKFVQGIIKSDDYKLIVAIKEGDIDEICKTTLGIEYRLVSEEQLLNKLINFQDYYRAIQKNYKVIPIMDGYKYTLNDIYTEPQCVVLEGKDHEIIPDSIETYIINWLNDAKDKKQIALLGEYGQGKSVFSQRLAYKLIQSPELSERIPIIMELRGKFPKSNKGLLYFFSDWCAPYGINPKALLKLYYAGKLLLIFEGFDEIEMVGDRKIRMEHFKSIWECCTSNSKIIITGRPNYFANDKEQKIFLRTKETDFTRQYCREIYIQKFDRQRVFNTLRKFPADVRTEIVSVWEQQSKNSSFIDLISRPSSLFLTGAIWKERNLSVMKDRLNSSTIINEFLLHCYDRQEQKEYKEVILSRNERAYFMQGIAVGMVQYNKYTNQISEANLNVLVKRLIEKFPDKLSEDNIDPLNRRLKKRYNRKYNEDDILLDIRTCGVLVRDTMTIDTFKFAHKSFLELLISKYYVTYLFQDDYRDDDVELIAFRAIKNTLSVIEDELSQTPDVFQFVTEQCTHDFKFDEYIDPQNKVEIIFSKICRAPLSLKLYTKAMYICGVDVRLGFLTLLGMFVIVGMPLYISSVKLQAPDDPISILNYITIGFIIIGSIYFYYKTTRNRSVSISVIAIFPFIFERLLVRIMKTTDFVLPKYNRLLMFFVVCKKYDLHPLLQDMMPKFAYKALISSLEVMENRLSGAEDLK